MVKYNHIAAMSENKSSTARALLASITSNQPQLHGKVCSSTLEFEIYELLRGTGIVPDFVSVEDCIYSILYPTTLADYVEGANPPSSEQLTLIHNKIDQLVYKLHSAGVLHGDLHGHNVVLNPDTLDVRLIDLEHAQLIADLWDDPTSHLEFFNDFWDSNYTNVPEMLNHEYSMYK